MDVIARGIDLPTDALALEQLEKLSCHFSLVLLGEEFVINMGSTGLDGYREWRASMARAED